MLKVFLFSNKLNGLHEVNGQTMSPNKPINQYHTDDFALSAPKVHFRYTDAVYFSVAIDNNKRKKIANGKLKESKSIQ